MKLFNRTYGESGTPLIILHGLFGLSDNWTSLAKRFSGEGHLHVIVPDLANHGQSPRSDAFDYTSMMADVMELIKDKDLAEVYLMGHSMGGKVAMELAVNHSEKVKKLIVADIGPKYYPLHHQQILDAMFSLDLSKMNSRKEAEEDLSKHFKDRGLVQFLLKNLYWTEDSKLDWRMNLPVISKNIHEVGRALEEDAIYSGPALFVKGENSNYIEAGDWADITKHFPHADLEEIKEAGHWVNADKPAEFYDVAMRFLTNN